MKIAKSLTMLMVCTSASLAQADDTYILKVAHFLPASSNAQQNAIQPWCDELAKESDNRLKCQIYPSMQLGGTPAQLPDQVRNGIADIVWTVPGYSSGRFPRSEAVELPFMLPANGALGSQIIWDFYEQSLQADYKDYKVLAMHSDAGTQLHLANAPVLSLEDFKGLKVRASSRMAAKLISAMGASPVSMPASQLTESLSKGVIDGALVGWELIPALKIDEVAPVHTEPKADQPIFYTSLLSLLMNKKRYEALPADLRALIDRKSGRELSVRFGRTWDKEAERARAMVLQRGADAIRVIDDAQYQRMRESGDPVIRTWAEDKKNINGSQLVESLRSIAAAATAAATASRQ
ncbi:TRAP transporter substrate-binding protein [Pseudomonas capeferrum]|uniref:TRAP transporter substrate-binding protein n=1 Tax=Pseudomonas capeferrum TaxID=1495066 RepID=UPI0015E44A82|nr:TRAP transporter substrate-binding protein [Pseudomonas capeferrum]MBA1203205.1 TRAP transporter substrate-binding protein [Pseudomonas capeferrum]